MRDKLDMVSRMAVPRTQCLQTPVRLRLSEAHSFRAVLGHDSWHFHWCGAQGSELTVENGTAGKGLRKTLREYTLWVFAQNGVAPGMHINGRAMYTVLNSYRCRYFVCDLGNVLQEKPDKAYTRLARTFT